jgi:hypothetical protein
MVVAEDDGVSDVRENPCSVVAHGHDRPTPFSGALECGFGTLVVSSFAVGIVVGHKDPKSVSPFASGEAEHLDITVGVSDSHEWSASEPAPDTNWLGRSVVKEFDLRFVEQRCDLGVGVEVKPEALPMTCSGGMP